MTSYGLISFPSIASEEFTERIMEVLASLSIIFLSIPRHFSRLLWSLN